MENNNNSEHAEGKVAKAIEQQTAKLPSDIFLWSGLGALALSGALFCMGKKHTSLMVGQWAAPVLIMGLYDKIVKELGHDATDEGEDEYFDDEDDDQDLM